jgi:hypothetical protein
MGYLSSKNMDMYKVESRPKSAEMKFLREIVKKNRRKRIRKIYYKTAHAS